MRRTTTIATAAIVAALAFPAGASAATVTLGTPDPARESEVISQCTLAEGCVTQTLVPTALTDPGSTLVAPADGTIVSWRVRGAPPQYLRLRVVRREADGSFKGMGTSGIAKVGDGSAGNSVKMAIDTGQQIGIDLSSQPSSLSITTLDGGLAAGAAWSSWESGLADGTTSAPTTVATGSWLSFNATVELFRPSIVQVSPLSAPATGATPVYITGRHLTKVTGVSFGGVPAQVVEEIPEQVLVLAPPHPPGKVDVVVETAGGPSLDSAADDFTYLGPSPAADRRAPRLSRLDVSPRAFLPAPGGPSAIASAALGAAITYRLSEAARTKFTIQRRDGKRYRRLPGAFTHRGSSGTNRFRFTGRLSRRKLAPGRYRLMARSVDPAGNRSALARHGFTILGSRAR
ncbi:MAG TPA: IPT/TIG domain-containing protein [Solirubrobacterales bacterium]|nr:IPT/TIG domain-containing protein [Solirubrobacterales bacterium]